ncbi:rnhA operon protein [Natrialbaceae archaeon GCM10025810]|uniref:DUF7108 family protein n=1 Tax=Halovalidus salilacus TaxID=3075124 RepID=UPI0036211D1F
MHDSNDLEGDDPGTARDDDADAELPREVVEEAERLTRLARSAVDEAEREAHERRRANVLSEFEFTARVREDDGNEVLVLHPAEWREDGVIRTDRIDDLSRAVEIPLDGPDDPDDWEAVDERNRDLVAAVREVHGDVHGDTAAALADFMSNHYAKPIESATGEELTEFCTEYFVRNAWPSLEQREKLEESIRRVFETAGRNVPGFRAR